MRSVVMPCRSGPSATTLSATDQGAILAIAERADAVSDQGSLEDTPPGFPARRSPAGLDLAFAPPDIKPDGPACVIPDTFRVS